MTTTVKSFTSSITGAPVLSGTAGALIAVLDACLVDGFGLQAVTSLVVASGTATATLATTPVATAGSVVLISGATPSGLNGEQRVLTTASNTLTFATALADQTATGSISVKLAPAGWEKVYSGTNLAVYRSPNVAGTRQFLRADDTGTTSATMRAYESMTDVNTGTDNWMDNYWFKSAAATATAVPWQIYADDRTFYLRTEAGNQDAIYPFGDITPVRANDPFACIGPDGYPVATANSTSNTAASVTANAYPIGSSPTASLRLPRSANFLSKNVTAFKRPELLADHSTGGDQCISSGCKGYSGYYLLPYPNTSDNALVFTRFNVFESSNRNLRGALRGIFCSPQWLTASFADTLTVLDGQGPFAGRKIGVAECSGGSEASGAGYFTTLNGAQTPSGRLIVDLTGPW